MHLETARPGILPWATRASPIWRNAVAAALSSGVRNNPNEFVLRATGDVGGQNSDAEIAGVFISMRPNAIIEAAYPVTPAYLPAALRKIGSSLLSTPAAYTRLHALLGSEEPEQQARARVLERLDAKLDDELIQVVEVLDLAILTPKTAMAVRTASEARSVNARIPVIKQLVSTASDESLRQSIEDSPSFRASNWARRWVCRADRLPRLGIALDESEIERITPANAQSMGREWHNCLLGHRNALAVGATAYFALNDLSVIVVLTRTDGGWVLSAIHGRANMPVRPETARRVQERLTALGVVCLMPLGPPPELKAIAGAFHDVDELDFDFEGMTVPG